MPDIGLDRRMWAPTGLDPGMTGRDSTQAIGTASVGGSNTTTGGIAITTAIIITRLRTTLSAIDVAPALDRGDLN